MHELRHRRNRSPARPSFLPSLMKFDERFGGKVLKAHPQVTLNSGLIKLSIVISHVSPYSNPIFLPRHFYSSSDGLSSSKIRLVIGLRPRYFLNVF